MRLQVLDHGYVELVESWGSDERIIESARMSTNKGFAGWGPLHTERCNEVVGTCICPHDHDSRGDEKLLRHLYTHRHMSPFEMAGATFEVQAPIFVFREWHRHRTQSYNELSARYTPLPNLNYTPSRERMAPPDTPTTNKQAKPAFPGRHFDRYDWFRMVLENSYADSENVYRQALEAGVPKELARLVIPVARYSRMRAQANLRNWLQFLTLRCHESAQWEIRQYANVVRDELTRLFPRTLELWKEEQGGTK